MLVNIQDAVKREALFVFCGCAIGTLIIIGAFYILHGYFPEKVPFGFPVVTGALVGCIIAAGNFFWMALTVQKISAIDDEPRAKATMALSYRYRTLMQIVWVIMALALPIFNGAAGIIPLFIPSIIIKIRGILSTRSTRKER